MALVNHKTLAVLSSGHVCIDVCQGAVPILLPALISERHLSISAAAGLVLATNIASSVVQPAFGYSADRLHASWLMPLGLIMGGGGLVLASLVPDYWQIALFLGLSGIGVAAFHPEAARQMHSIAGKQRATNMSLFSIGGTLGFAIGPLALGGLLHLFGLGGTSALLIPLAVMALILVLYFRNLAILSKKEGQPKERVGTDNWSAFARLTGAVISRSMIFYGLNTFIPLYWINVLHQSEIVAGAALSFMLLVGIVGTLTAGRLADRLGRKRIILTSFILLLPCLLLFAMLASSNVVVATIMLIPVGFLVFAPFSVMIVLGQEYLPGHVGTASGVTLGLAVTIGGIIAPLLGRGAELYGLPFVLYAVAFLPLLGIACAWSLPQLTVAKE